MKTIAKTMILGLSTFGACATLLLTANAVNARPIAANPVHIHYTAAPGVRHTAYVTNNNLMVDVRVEKPAGVGVKVEFLNEAGHVLAYRHLPRQEANTYSLKFDVAHLDDGQYEVRILGKGVAANYAVELKTPSPKKQVRLLSMR
jgi:hypothetical protein